MRCCCSRTSGIRRFMLFDVGKKGHVKVLGGFSGVHGPAYEKLPAFLCPDGGFVSFFKGDVAHSLQCAAHQCLVHQGLFCFAPIAQQSHGDASRRKSSPRRGVRPFHPS